MPGFVINPPVFFGFVLIVGLFVYISPEASLTIGAPEHAPEADSSR